MTTRLAAVALLLCVGCAHRAQRPAVMPTCKDAVRLEHGGALLPMPDGTSLWYRTLGKPGAPPVVFLHGGPGYNAYAFEQTLGPALAADFFVVAVDQRGCGRSGFDGPPALYGVGPTVDDLERLRAALKLPPWLVLGHSFGGLVGAAYAARHPAALSGLVLLEATPNVASAIAHQVDAVRARVDTTFADKAGELRPILDAPSSPFATLGKLYDVLGRSALQRMLQFGDSAEAQATHEALDAQTHARFCSAVKVMDAYQAEGLLGPADVKATPLPVPTLLLAGKRSQMLGEANVDAARAAWGATLDWVDAGHFLYAEQPAAVAEHVRRFVQGRAPVP